jgi:hypothetical protein
MLAKINSWEMIKNVSIWRSAMFKLVYITIGWKTLLVILAFLLLRRKLVAAIQRLRQPIP